uniref:Uncharacterized protein n=1 Tax=Tanacetum cinerariifolium TaxID=118510 RepID=A0A699HPS1_TANCI|nr:hypothetical protein [Tanacetum cinerariifolium]
MYKENLAKFWYSDKTLENFKVSLSILAGGIYGDVEVNTFRNAIDAHYLIHYSEYVAPPSIDIILYRVDGGEFMRIMVIYGLLWLIIPFGSLANGINIDYASIFWEDIIIKLNKKQMEKVVPYTRFLSLLIMHKMKEGYRDGDVTLYPTQVFSANNWALKPNQPEEDPFAYHMLAICFAAKPVTKKHSTSLKQPSVSSKEATKGRSSKAPTGSKTGHLKKKKDSSSTIESNPSQTSVSTPVVTEIHKEDQQATGGPKSLGVTGEEIVDHQLSSGMSTFNLNKPIYSASFIIHSKFASGYDASANSTAKADLGKSAPSDFIPQQQGMIEETKNTSYDQLFAGTDLHVLADQTKSVSEGLKIVLNQSTSDKGASNIAKQIEEVEASSTIKLKDLVKLTKMDFMLPQTLKLKMLKFLNIHLPSKKIKKIDFVTEGGKYIYLNEEKINHQKKIEKEAKAQAAKHKSKVRKEELVDLLGPEVVNKYYNDKLQYDRYYDKMLNRIAKSRITNCDVLIKKGSITLKVYRKDGTSEVIPNFKASDLHLCEWIEVMNACPNRTSKGWKIIYDQICSRMDYIHTTKVELGINLDVPLSK